MSIRRFVGEVAGGLDEGRLPGPVLARLRVLGALAFLGNNPERSDSKHTRDI